MLTPWYYMRHDKKDSLSLPPSWHEDIAELFISVMNDALLVCRLLFIWEAYETSPNVYNASYLAYYDGVVDYLWNSLGIRSIVDVHQVCRLLSGFPAYLMLWLLRTVDTPGQRRTNDLMHASSVESCPLHHAKHCPCSQGGCTTYKQGDDGLSARFACGKARTL